MIVVGSVVEIRPAFSCETGERTIWDEIAGCEGEVVAVHLHDDSADVRIKSGDVAERVAWARLKPRGA